MERPVPRPYPHQRLRFRWSAIRQQLTPEWDRISFTRQVVGEHIICLRRSWLFNYIFNSGLTAIAALKRKRKKFSSSKNICPVTESVAAANAAEILNDKVSCSV